MQSNPSSPQRNAPIGILGGTFDPIHHGHLRLAQEALEQCALQAVRFIPAGTPPHRPAPQASAQARWEMAQQAIAGHPDFLLDMREVFRTDPCYTVDTLAALRAELGNQQPLCLILGSDAFLNLPAWHEWERLFGLAHLVVVQRANTPPLGNAMKNVATALQEIYRNRLVPSPQALRESPAGALLVMDMPALEISSTDIRRRCAEGRSIRYLIPDAVAHYIATHALYRTC